MREKSFERFRLRTSAEGPQQGRQRFSRDFTRRENDRRNDDEGSNSKPNVRNTASLCRSYQRAPQFEKGRIIAHRPTSFKISIETKKKSMPRFSRLKTRACGESLRRQSDDDLGYKKPIGRKSGRTTGLRPSRFGLAEVLIALPRFINN